FVRQSSAPGNTMLPGGIESATARRLMRSSSGPPPTSSSRTRGCRGTIRLSARRSTSSRLTGSKRATPPSTVTSSASTVNNEPRDTAVEARALAVRVDDLGARLADQPKRTEDRPPEAAESIDVKRGELDAHHRELLAIPTVLGAADADGELVAGKTPNEVID